jgi:hypothetical protein
MTKSFGAIALAAGSVLLGMVSCANRGVSAARAADLPKRYHELPSPDVERGEKLADVMLCAMCHSPMTLEGGLQMYNEKLRLTGGIKIVSPPDGTFFTKNLTPDVKTGIGGWSFEELAAAITQGVTKDGRGLRVMPTHYYRNITNEDLNALIAYLKSIPPVQKQIPPNVKMGGGSKLMAGIRLVMPFVGYPSQDWYFGDYVTSAIEPVERGSGFDISPKSDEPLVVRPVRTSPEIERGKYLVTTSACAYCHTPVGLSGQSSQLALAGGFKVVDPVCGTVYTRNLTPDGETGLGRWSDQEIVRAVRNGISKGERRLCPTIMPWQAFAKFSDDEMRAIVAYLRAIPPVRHKIPDATPPTGNEAKFQKFTLGDAGYEP